MLRSCYKIFGGIYTLRSRNIFKKLLWYFVRWCCHFMEMMHSVIFRANKEHIKIYTKSISELFFGFVVGAVFCSNIYEHFLVTKLCDKIKVKTKKQLVHIKDFCETILCQQFVFSNKFIFPIVKRFDFIYASLGQTSGAPYQPSKIVIQIMMIALLFMLRVEQPVTELGAKLSSAFVPFAIVLLFVFDSAVLACMSHDYNLGYLSCDPNYSRETINTRPEVDTIEVQTLLRHDRTVIGIQKDIKDFRGI